MKIFSPALKDQLGDCILAIFWPKKKIFRFFKDCSVPTQSLSQIMDWDEKELSRARMVDDLFDALGEQPDNGTMHFNLMLDALAEWSHFDDYWFNVQKKLDLEDAKRKIAALRSAKEKSVDTAKKRFAKQREKAAAKEERHKSLEEMRQDFQMISLGSETSQKRGIAFEKFLAKMMRFFEVKVTDSFRVTGTQIDGAIKFDGEHYNIEAKWHDHSLSDEPLMAFCHKQERNMHGRGIFISINGVTAGALHMLERSAVKNTVLMDGEDITLILTEMTTFPEVLDAKIKGAQTRGDFFINPLTGKSKIPH